MSLSLIKPSVLAAWRPFSEPLEGRVPYMYLDIKGLVTTAVGVLIDPEPMAHALPWRDATGARATSHQVRTAWGLVKNHADPERHHREAGRLTTLRLTEADLDAIVDERLARTAAGLTKRFPEFPTWPADAQLATLSMAWAMGSAFWGKFPRWSAAADRREWRLCAGHGVIRDGLNTPDPTDDNAGVVPRNKLNRAHFLEANTQLSRRYPEVLHGPGTLDALKAGWKSSEAVETLPLP